MTGQTVTLAGREFVIVPKAHYRRLERCAGVQPVRKSRRASTKEPHGVSEAIRRLQDPADREVPYAEARKRLGLA